MQCRIEILLTLFFFGQKWTADSHILLQKIQRERKKNIVGSLIVYYSSNLLINYTYTRC